MEEGALDEKLSSSSKKTVIEDYSARTYTLFMTKTAEQPYPLGTHMPIYLMQGSTPRDQKDSRFKRIISFCGIRFVSLF